MAQVTLDDIYRVDFRGNRGRFPELSLKKNVIDAIKNRLSTPKGRMPFNALYGTKLKSFLSETVTPELLNSISQEIQTQILKDYRVRDVISIQIETIKENQLVCNVSLTIINATDTLEFRLII